MTKTEAQCEDATIVVAVTAVVREADQAFERSGGSSRHWVRDCFLPLLNRAGWVIQTTEPFMCRHCREPLRQDADGDWIDAETHTVCRSGQRHEAIASVEVSR